MDKDEDGNELDPKEGEESAGERSEEDLEAGEAGDEDSDDGEGKRAADDKGEADPERIIKGLRKRTAKLAKQRDKARADAAERDALAAELAAYKKRDEDAKRMLEEARRRTPEGMQAEERRRAVRATIAEAYGEEGDEVLSSARSNRERDELIKEQYAMQGVAYIREELESHDVKPETDTQLLRWERAIGSELEEDAELLARYKRPSTQKAAIEEAFARVRTSFANPILKTQGAKPLERIQRNREALLSGGSNRGSVAEAPEPVFDLTPPKELSGPALTEWWREARNRYRSSLPSEDRA